MNEDDEAEYGFDSDFFAAVLADIPDRPGLVIKADNYFSYDGAGVGDVANGPFYNLELEEPHEIDDIIFKGEGLSNNHTGVQQWYRWTMDPSYNPFPQGSSVCQGPIFVRGDDLAL
jgi:hypothetical protein